MLNQVNGLGGGYPGDTGLVTLSAGTGRWYHQDTGHETSGTESGCGFIPETGQVTPCIWSGRSHPGYYRNLTPDAGSRKGLPTLETVYV